MHISQHLTEQAEALRNREKRKIELTEKVNELIKDYCYYAAWDTHYKAWVKIGIEPNDKAKEEVKEWLLNILKLHDDKNAAWIHHNVTEADKRQEEWRLGTNA